MKKKEALANFLNTIDLTKVINHFYASMELKPIEKCTLVDIDEQDEEYSLVNGIKVVINDSYSDTIPYDFIFNHEAFISDQRQRSLENKKNEEFFAKEQFLKLKARFEPEV